MNPMQAMPQQAPMGGRPPMGGQPPMGPMGGPPMGGPPMGGPPMGGPQAGFSVPAAGINLFKVQEQLKDMPQQMVMAYANGQNPSIVPPYIALGEMERRTRAAKNAQPTQAPQGTVKDNLEQQIKQAAGLASLAGQRQQQAQQQQMSQSMQARGPVPGGVPPPEDQAEPPMMARGGLATLPVRDRMVSYRDGGIVGYAEGEVVEKPYIGYRSPRRQEQPENPDVDEEGNPRGRDERARILAKNAMIAQQKAQSERAAIREQQFKPVPGKEAMEQFYKPRSTQGPVAATVPSQEPTGSFLPTATLAASIEDIKDPIERARARQAMESQVKGGRLALPPQMPIPGQGAPSAMPGGMPGGMPGAAPSGIAGLPGAAPQGVDRLQAQLDKGEELIARMQRPQVISPEQQALINMPVEQDYMKRLRELHAKRGEEDVLRRGDIEERKKMDFTRAMLAGAESSRGYRGLGSLASGFARSSLDSRGARMNEEAALRASGLDREALLEKAQFEMSGLQRARAVGDRDREQKHMMELQKLEEQLRRQMISSAGGVTSAEIGADTRAAVAAATAGQAGETARSAAVKRAEDAYNNDAEVKQISKQLESPIFALGTTPAIKAQKDAMEKRREEIRKDKYRQQGITITESTTAPPIDLSKWGKPTKQ